ncbi:MAG: penicillin-binding protein activator LpoB [Pseudomonadales bacterium]|nr:penicillin-binding protein activator LpoB [Pseudomonadales bacterium]
MSKIIFRAFGVVTLVLSVSACTTTGPTLGSAKIGYGDTEAVETITNEFSSTDLKIMAESMTDSLLETSILSGRPTLTIAKVKNKTSEYVDTKLITDSIRSKMLKSGKVRFAVDVSAMENQTEELMRQSQSGLYKKSSAASIGNMVGAKYRLEGSISSIVKSSTKYKDVYYKLSLQLVDNESGLLEWADEKDIRKTTKR